MSTENKWYDLHNLLSKDKMISMVVSGRGYGKTYACKRKCIKDFINKGHQFVYLRRYKSELKGSNLVKWFDDISKEFEGHSFEVKGSTFIIDGKEAGFAIALTMQVQVRSVPFPNVHTIVFDEFILNDKGRNLKYLSDEVTIFLEVISTIARTRNNVRVICCANNISYVNPYYEYFKIRVNAEDGEGFYYPIGKKDGEVVLEIYKNEEFKDEVKATRFGRLTASTSYGAYAVENEAFMDSQEFIMKKPKDSKFLFSFKYDNKIYGCWYSDEYSIYHFNKKHDKSSKLCFAVTNDDQVFEMKNIKSMKKEPIIKKLKMFYESGLVFYEDINIKKDFNNIFKVLGF